MNVQEVQTFFAYNRWANRRLLEAAKRLSAEEIDRDLQASFVSIRGTLRHILYGEHAWLRFWQDGSFLPNLLPTDLPDLPSIEAAWAELEKKQDAFTRELSNEQLSAQRSVRDKVYTLGELIQHQLNHSTYHRGQVVLLLRQLGQKPPDTGFRLFLTESRQGEMPRSLGN